MRGADPITQSKGMDLKFGMLEKLCKLAKCRHNDVIRSNFGPPRNQIKPIFLESTSHDKSYSIIHF